MTKRSNPCHCKRGQHRDNCPDCEGTGQRIDFRAIRAKSRYEVQRYDTNPENVYTFETWCYVSAFPSRELAQSFVDRAEAPTQQLRIRDREAL